MRWIIDLVIGPAFPWLVAAVAAAGAFLAGQSKGSSKERRKEAERRADTAQEAREIDDAINKVGDDSARADLDGWLRKE